MIELDKIPQEQTDDFPMGVSEVDYATEAEIKAFIDGLDFPGDVDVANGSIFERGGRFVVRVKVGEWGEN